MALLLAMYQKMRLIREKNQITLDLAKYSSKVTRVDKNIKNVQKRYESLFAQIDAQAKMMQSTAKNIFNNMTGLGADQIFSSPYDYSGMTMFVINGVTEICKKGQAEVKDDNGNVIYPEIPGMSNDLIQDLITRYRRDGDIYPLKDADGKYIVKEYAEDGRTPKEYDYGNGINSDVIKFFKNAVQQSQQMQSVQKMKASQLSTMYDSNVSIWAEAQKAKLEEEQDAALQPLEYNQTMWQLEKEHLEQRLELLKGELESYTNLCKEEAKENAPKFGLG